MKRSLRWLLPLLLLALLALFVGRALQARKAEQALAASVVRPASELDLAPADVVVARVRELPRTLDISGGIKAVNSAVVKARVAAEVRELTVREGDAVKAGQVLGRLDTAELDWKLRQAEQLAASSKAQLEIAQRALENNRALVAQGFISPTALETSISTEAGARATLGSAQAAVGLARKARNDAVLRRADLRPGVAAAGAAGRTGARGCAAARDRRPLAPRARSGDRARGHRRAARRQPGDLARRRLDKPVAARVARINPSAQAGTRAIMAYLAIEPETGLRQGLFAKGTIELGRRNALALPLSAIRVDQALPYVLRIEAGKALVTPVRLGTRGMIDGQAWVEVAEGLAEGTPVLAASAGLVRDGTPVRLPAPLRSASASAPRP